MKINTPSSELLENKITKLGPFTCCYPCNTNGEKQSSRPQPFSIRADFMLIVSLLPLLQTQNLLTSNNKTLSANTNKQTVAVRIVPAGTSGLPAGTDSSERCSSILLHFPKIKIKTKRRHSVLCRDKGTERLFSSWIPLGKTIYIWVLFLGSKYRIALGPQ